MSDRPPHGPQHEQSTARRIRRRVVIGLVVLGVVAALVVNLASGVFEDEEPTRRPTRDPRPAGDPVLTTQWRESAGEQDLAIKPGGLFSVQALTVCLRRGGAAVLEGIELGPESTGIEVVDVRSMPLRLWIPQIEDNWASARNDLDSPRLTFRSWRGNRIEGSCEDGLRGKFATALTLRRTGKESGWSRRLRYVYSVGDETFRSRWNHYAYVLGPGEL